MHDPDLGAEDVRSPTLSRQGRQGLLQLSSHRPWQTWKADAKAAFLRGRSSQLDRQIFGMPVSELQEAMGLPKGKAIQSFKFKAAYRLTVAYGLTVAPREFNILLDEILQQLHLHRLKTDPSLCPQD